MLFLYHGSGATVTDFYDPALSEEKWKQLRRAACDLLRARSRSTAASLLERMPFELLKGTNFFQDDFCVLYATLSLEQYVKVEELRTTQKGAFEAIAETLSELGHYTRFVVAELDREERAHVPSPEPRFTSDTVRVALTDAERSISANSPASAVDRVHTALHGYLCLVLEREGIEHDPRAPLTRLFKLLREEHPALKDIGARSEDLRRIVMSAATVVDALSALRNHASVAHPTEALLGDAEAMLAINSARTLLHYLDAKIEP